MKAIILAAGEGTRLRPHTLERPKCLVEVDGRSLLRRQLDVLERAGVDEQVLVGGYLHEALEGYGSRLRLNGVYGETNMVYTLFCAEEELDGEVLVTYGDIVYSPRILRAVMACESDLAVAVDLEWESYWRERHEDPLDDAESLKIDSGGNITEIGQPPESAERIEGQYMGLMKFSRRGVRLIRERYHRALREGYLGGRPAEQAYMTDLLQAVIDDGHPVRAVTTRAPWVEVDTVDDLRSGVTRSRLAAIEQEIKTGKKKETKDSL